MMLRICVFKNLPGLWQVSETARIYKCKGWMLFPHTSAMPDFASSFFLPS